MVKTGVVLKRFGINRATFYSYIREGRIKAYDEAKPWHRRRQLRFLLSEVEAVLGPPRT